MKLSKKEIQFLNGKVGSKSMPDTTRQCALINKMTTTPRPTKPSMSIYDMALLGKKLHDREPAALIKAVENTWPCFFDYLEDGLNEVGAAKKKAAFISRFITYHFHHGVSRYEKPKLRKKRKTQCELATID
jgi:hypothetical protein